MEDEKLLRENERLRKKLRNEDKMEQLRLRNEKQQYKLAQQQLSHFKREERKEKRENAIRTVRRIPEILALKPVSRTKNADFLGGTTASKVFFGQDNSQNTSYIKQVAGCMRTSKYDEWCVPYYDDDGELKMAGPYKSEEAAVEKTIGLECAMEPIRMGEK